MWPTGADRQRAAIVFLVVLVLAATGLLTRPDALSALVEGLGDWGRQLFVAEGGMWRGFAVPLLVYEPVVLLFGLAGAVIAARDPLPLRRFLALWVVAGLVLGALTGRPLLVADALLPLTLAAGLALGLLCERLAERGTWMEDGVMSAILVMVLTYSLIQAFSFANYPDQSLGSTSWLLSMGGLGMVGLLLIVYVVLWGGALAVRVIGVTAAVSLAFLAWSNGTSLNYRAADVLREPMRPNYVAPGASRLAENLAEASWVRTRDPHAWPVVVDPSLAPSLAWRLREHDVRWGAVEGTLDENAAIVPSTTPAVLGPASYVGQSYVVAGVWEPNFFDRHALARWLLQRREADHTTAPGYVRADLYINVE